MAYSDEDRERVRERTDLVELATEITKVKRSGRSVMAVCPFHQEKTPSLSIDQARGLYHCFGCGKSGDVFSWVQESQSLDFREALELLARRAGVTLTESPADAKRRGRREELVRATQAAVDFYRERLKTGADAGAARSYVRGRGYGADVVERFDMGYSPDDWSELTLHLKGKGFAERTLIDAGLSSKSRVGRLIDRFRGRLMFPIFDLRGDPVGFGARLLEGDGPKYLNTSETAIYHKSTLLYGLNWAKGEIVRRGASVVVEGYTDVIALHLAGQPVAVATCGTALGEDHLDLLRRFSERVLLAFDADEAGAGAALRGFDMAVPGDLDLRVVMLPEGRDPADLVGEGDEQLLLDAMEHSQPLLQFSVDRELAKHDLGEAEARGRAIRAVAAMIARHHDPLVRHEYSVAVSRRTGVDLRMVEEAVAGASRARRAESERPARSKPRKLTGLEKAEQELLRLVMANGAALPRDDIDVTLFTAGPHRDAFELIWPEIIELAPAAPPDLGRILTGVDSDEAKLLAELALMDGPESDARDVINRLKVGAVRSRIEQLQRELEGRSGGDQEYSDKFEELLALQQEKQRLRSRE